MKKNVFILLEIISRYPAHDHVGFALPDSVALFCLPLGAVIECWPEKAQPPFPIFSTFALTGAKGEKVRASAAYLDNKSEAPDICRFSVLTVGVGMNGLLQGMPQMEYFVYFY